MSKRGSRFGKLNTLAKDPEASRPGYASNTTPEARTIGVNGLRAGARYRDVLRRTAVTVPENGTLSIRLAPYQVKVFLPEAGQ